MASITITSIDQSLQERVAGFSQDCRIESTGGRIFVDQTSLLLNSVSLGDFLQVRYVCCQHEPASTADAICVHKEAEQRW